jgi:hypothetical protein
MFSSLPYGDKLKRVGVANLATPRDPKVSSSLLVLALHFNSAVSVFISRIILI